jgi:hypothetical protein
MKYSFYSTKYARRREMEGSYDENGPKQCKTHRLGPRYVFLFFYLYIMILTHVLL